MQNIECKYVSLKHNYTLHHTRASKLKQVIRLSLIDPSLGVRLPGVDTLREPQTDLLLRSLDAVRAVADVATDVEGEVTADGARGRVGGLGGTEHDTASLDGAHTLPHHAAHGTRVHVLNQTSEKALRGQIRVVLLKKGSGGGEKLKSLELEALLLKSRNDFTNQTSLDAIGLDHDISSLHCCCLLIFLVKL